MKRQFFTRAVIIGIFSLFMLAEGIGLAGCANMIPPSGGPRDSIPPVLLKATPGDSSRNFTNNRITFVFDEYVEVSNIMENLIVSPTPKIAPFVEGRLRTVTVSLKDTLEPNTTYTLNFGNAIRDINEGNELKDFTYIFSTGPVFDTMQLSGKVFLAETGGIDSTLIVMLHTGMDDSAVVNERPRYYTRVDRDGNFRFQNLPPGSFNVYALKDEGGSKRYQSPSQLFGFANDPVKTGAGAPPIVLYAYREKADTRGGATSGTATTGRSARANTTDRMLRITTNIENEQLDLLGNLEVRFSNPLKNFDSTKLKFTDEQFNVIPSQSPVLDTSRKLLTFKHPWIGNTVYNIIVDRDFAEDSLGRKIPRTDTLNFRTRKEADYGSLKLRFLNLDMSKNPVLLFVQNEQVRYTHVFTGRDVNIRLFVPGEYELRILFDENRNGKWDPGEFFGKHRQSEKVQPITRRLTVKPNWDNEVDITL
ncbi:MAG: Ig-like domain-containing domain [Chitinophagaceae bacterium]